NAQTIGGTQSYTITNLANNDTSGTGLTFSGAQPTVTTLTQGTNAILSISGSTVPTFTTLTATASGNIVDYKGTTQTCKATTYVNLKLDGTTSTDTCLPTDVTGTMTVGGGISWAPAA